MSTPDGTEQHGFKSFTEQFNSTRDRHQGESAGSKETRICWRRPQDRSGNNSPACAGGWSMRARSAAGQDDNRFF